MNKLITTNCTDPYLNLALEELLLERHEKGVLLYLWQNSHTVVIGRNQNAWKECRIEALEQSGGKIARRCSGGGAVYHDMGNLNFTFITTKEGYDLERQLGVIVAALSSMGIAASFTGRNDIVSEDGAKLSGNAFRYTSKASMHHGTILVSADMHKLGRYLMPSRSKLAAKGVDSVRSRVGNLIDILPGVTVEDVRSRVAEAFISEYGGADAVDAKNFDCPELEAKREWYASWEWNKGATPKFDLSLETRFPWGGLELELELSEGRIAAARAYSDAMDELMILRLPALLKGVMLEPRALHDAALLLGSKEAEDIAQWLLTAEI